MGGKRGEGERGIAGEEREGEKERISMKKER